MSSRSSLPAIAAGTVLTFAGGVLGALLGAVYVRHFVPPAPDGWTGIANALGGLMVGGGAGLVVGLLLVGLLARRSDGALWKGAGGLLLGALVTFGYLAATRPDRSAAAADLPTAPPEPPAFEPDFWFGISHPSTNATGRVEAPDGGRTLPFAAVGAYAASARLEVHRLPHRAHCRAALSSGRLAELLPVARTAARETERRCQTPEEDLSVYFRWHFADGDPELDGDASLDMGCLPDEPALQALIADVQALIETVDGAAACEPSA